MNNGALNNALEAGGWLCLLLLIFEFEICQIILDKLIKLPPQVIQIDITCAHHSRGILVSRQCQKEMFQRCKLMLALRRKSDRTVKCIV